jgi:hypothetical protein
MSLPRIVVSENLAHGLRKVTAPDQEPIRPRPCGRVRQWIMTEFPAEREASDFDIAPTLHDRRDRRLDDVIGDSSTSQFVRHAQTPVAAVQEQLLGATPRQRGVVEIAELAQAEKRVGDRRRREAAAHELRLDLGSGARRAREQAKRYGAGVAVGARTRCGLRSDRS